MKRDMDLVRQMLLFTEEHSAPSTAAEVKIEGRSDEEVSYHLALMKDAGLIEARSPGKYGPMWAVLGLTWAGHDFLDAARDANRWSTAKKIGEKVGSVSFEVVTALLTELGKRAVFSALGGSGS